MSKQPVPVSIHVRRDGRTRESIVWLPVPDLRGSPPLVQLGRVRDTGPLEVTSRRCQKGAGRQTRLNIAAGRLRKGLGGVKNRATASQKEQIPSLLLTTSQQEVIGVFQAQAHQ